MPSVFVLHGDATEPPSRADSVDGVFVSGALSATPDPETVLDEISRTVRPGARLVVTDGRVPDGLLRNALRGVYRWSVNIKNPYIIATLRSRSTSVAVLETVDAGVGFIARADIEEYRVRPQSESPSSE